MRRAGDFLLFSGLAALMAPQASASWVDEDFYCRVYGCVVVHDGFSFDVYDVYDFDTGRTAAPGQRLKAWSGNPIVGTGSVNPVITGTRTEALTRAPLEDQGMLVGLDFNGDGTPDRMVSDDNNSGYLDAGDSLDPFNITASTRLVTASTSAQRSFYLTSRTDFYLTAQVYPEGAGFGTLADLETISLDYGVSRSGSDDGMDYGDDARNGNFIRDIGSADTLADLASGPQALLEFRNDIRRRSSNNLPDQSVRFDYVYAFDRYDLAAGDGSLRYRVEFDFYNR